MELYYRRNESVRKGRTIPARTQTVVIFLPDVRSCIPTRIEWDDLTTKYKRQLDLSLRKDVDVTNNNLIANNDISPVCKSNNDDSSRAAKNNINDLNPNESSETCAGDIDDIKMNQIASGTDDTATIEIADNKRNPDGDHPANEKALLILYFSLSLFHSY